MLKLEKKQLPTKEIDIYISWCIWERFIFIFLKKEGRGRREEASIQISVEALCLCKAQQLHCKLPSLDDLSPEQDRLFWVQV